MQSAAASVHPTRRGPTAEAGWATATGRTKVSRAAVDAVAACGDAMPAKSTTKPTTAMVSDCGDLLRRDDRAQHDEAGSPPRRGPRRTRHGYGAGR